MSQNKAGYNEDWERLRQELPDPFGTDSPPESETWIVEREPKSNRHDEPEEFYEQLAHRMRRVHKWLFVENHSLNSTFEENDENSLEGPISESGSWPRHELVTVQAEVHREDEVTSDGKQGCDKWAHVERNKFSGSPILGSSRVVYARDHFNDGSIDTEAEIPDDFDIILRSSTPKNKRRLSYDGMSDCTYSTFCSHKKKRYTDGTEVNSIDARKFVSGVSSPARHIHSMETIVPEGL